MESKHDDNILQKSEFYRISFTYLQIKIHNGDVFPQIGYLFLFFIEELKLMFSYRYAFQENNYLL